MATNKSRNEELLELGKKLQQFYDSGYINKKQTIFFSFLKGLASGVGAFLGGTIVIGLLLWILSLFSHIPLLDHVVDIVRDSINTK